MAIGLVTIPATSRRWYTVEYPWLRPSTLPANEGLGDSEIITTLTATVVSDDNNIDDTGEEYQVLASAIDSTGQFTQVLAGGGVEGNIYYIDVAIVTNFLQHQTDRIKVTIDSGE